MIIPKAVIYGESSFIHFWTKYRDQTCMLASLLAWLQIGLTLFLLQLKAVKMNQTGEIEQVPHTISNPKDLQILRILMKELMSV